MFAGYELRTIKEFALGIASRELMSVLKFHIEVLRSANYHLCTVEEILLPNYHGSISQHRRIIIDQLSSRDYKLSQRFVP
jgi:hypothetical protein